MPDAEQLVRALFSAFSSRDVDALVEIVHPEGEFHALTGDLSRPGRRYVGHAGMRTYLEDIDAQWEEQRVEVRELHTDEDAVVVVGRLYAWGGGRIIDAPAAWLWRIRDGKIVYGRAFPDPQEALQAAGLSV